MNAKEIILNGARDYINDARMFNYNDDFLEIESKKGLDNYGLITSKLNEYPSIDVATGNFQTFDEIAFNAQIINLMTQILGGRFSGQIESFTKITINAKSENPFDNHIQFTYNNDFSAAKVDSFLAPGKGNSVNMVSCGHEYIHGLLLPKYGKKYNAFFVNVHYHEFPSIMGEKIMAHELNKITNDNVNQKVTEFRHDCSAEHLRYINDYTERFKKYPSLNNEILSTYFQNVGYGYIISDVYATYLFGLYLEDPVHFLKLYRSLIKGNISIIEYFKIYGVNLEDEKIVNAYLKEMKYEKSE